MRTRILLLGVVLASGSGCSTIATLMMNDLFRPASVVQTEEQAAQTFVGQFMGALSEPSENPHEWALATEVFEKLKGTLAKREGGAAFNYRVIVLKSKMINAFSAPNGRVFLFSGMLDVIQDDHELAVVLGHEIAHAELRHYQRRRAEGARLDVTFGLRSLKFGRDQEVDSDIFGAKLAKEAGYDPGRYFFLHDRLGRLFGEKRGLAIEFLMTHPFSSTRRSALRRAGYEKPKKSLARVHPLIRKIREERRKEATAYGEASWKDVFDSPAAMTASEQLAINLVNWELQFDLAFEYLNRGWERTKDVRFLPWMAYAAAKTRGARKARHLAFKGREANPWTEVAFHHALSQYGESYDRWNELSEKESCRESEECLRRAVMIGDRIFPYGQGAVGEIGALYEKKLAAKGQKKLSSVEQRALNIALARQSQDATREEDWAFALEPKEVALWSNLLEPSAYYQDMKSAHEIARSQNLDVDEYFENGTLVNLQFSGMSLEGGLSEVGAFGTAFGFDAGFRFWPFDIFFTLSRQSGSNDASFELLEVGGGLGWAFRTGILAHWFRWSLSRAEVFSRPRFDDQNSTADGLSTTLSYGWSLPMIQIFGTHAFLRPEAEIGYFSVSPFAGSGGKGWGWRVGVGVEFLAGSRGRTPGVEGLLRKPRSLY
jgi:hypothetical protein